MPAAAAAASASLRTNLSAVASLAEPSTPVDPPARLRWPAGRRLRRTRDFGVVYDAGRKAHGQHVVLFGRVTDAGPTRVGLTVGRKVGNAVIRNRVRRRLRAWVREHYAQLPPGMDLVIVARAPAVVADAAELRLDLTHCAARLGRALST